MPRLLITGGAGFIGTHLANAAELAGWEVHVLDLVAQQPKLESKITFTQGDIRDKNTVERLVSNCEAVVHLAAQISVPDSFANPEKTHAINVEGTDFILEASHKFDVEKVILASSAAVYGVATSLPLKEDAAGECISPYATSKWKNELQVGQFRKRGLNTIALRFFNVYGPGQGIENSYASVIPKFLHLMSNDQTPTIYGNGKQTRDFIHVQDVVSAIMKLLGLQHSFLHSVVNVCTEIEHSILDLTDIIEKGFEKRKDDTNYLFEDEREGDIIRSCGSNLRLRSMISWKPEKIFEDSILELIKGING
jgi:UDP-glucose 4-epimerase